MKGCLLVDDIIMDERACDIGNYPSLSRNIPILTYGFTRTVTSTNPTQLYNRVK